MTATAAEAEAVILITVDGAEHENDTAATWDDGANTVRIVVNVGDASETYEVVVTKE